MTIRLVNNTGSSVLQFREALIGHIANGEPLAEELADIFSVEIIRAEDLTIGVIEWRDDD